MNNENVRYAIDASELDKIVAGMIDELFSSDKLTTEKTLFNEPTGEEGKVFVKKYEFTKMCEVTVEGFYVTCDSKLKYGGFEILTDKQFMGDVKFHKCTIRGKITSPNRMVEHSKIVSLVFDECDMYTFEFHHMDIVMSAFYECNLTYTAFEFCTLGHGTKFRGCTYVDTEFVDCDFSGTTFDFNCEQDGYAFNENLSNELGATFNGCKWYKVRGIKVVEVSNFGTYRGSAVFLPEIDSVYAGCWDGTFDSFVDQCIDILLDDADVIVNDALCDRVRPQYLGAIRYFATFIGEEASETLKYAESHDVFKSITGG